MTVRYDLPEDEIVRDYLAGAGMKDLAKKNGCSTVPIKRVLDEHGVAARPPWRPIGSPDRPGSTERRRRGQLYRYHARAALESEVTHHCVHCGITVSGTRRTVLRHVVRCKARAVA